jgi:serine/threonine protein kinase/lipoprotein NlpI
MGAHGWMVGDRIANRWEVHRILRGGMGLVYIVYDQDLGEPFAAKTFLDEAFADNSSIAKRFTREALTWINLGAHPNIVQARRVHLIRGKPFLFMEYVGGGDLAAWVGSGTLTNDLSQVLILGIQFCDGMIHAGARGIKAHRDIKPENCLITTDRALKITDFGISKVFEGEDSSGAGNQSSALERLFRPFRRRQSGSREGPEAARRIPGITQSFNITRLGTVMGTYTHMAPEQFSGAQVDARSDIYSFGIMLYQMLTGTLPLLGSSWQQYEHLHKTGKPENTANHPPIVNDVVQTCLAKNPSGRFHDFTELRGRLGEVYERTTGRPCPEQQKRIEEPDAHVWSHKAADLIELGRYQDAISCCDNALSLDRENYAAWNNKGNALARIGRLEEAVGCYDKVIAIDTRAHMAFSNKGGVLIRMGRVQEAVGCFESALSIDPTDYNTWNNKGLALGKLGLHEKAIACYDRAISLNPDYWEPWANMGGDHSSMGRDDLAAECYDRAAALNPYEATLRVKMGLSFLSLGRAEEALACFDNSLALNAEDIWSWYLRGLALNKLGRHEDAVSSLDSAIQLNPHRKDVWREKALALSSLGRFKESLLCLDEARRLGLEDADELVALISEQVTKPRTPTPKKQS